VLGILLPRCVAGEAEGSPPDGNGRAGDIQGPGPVAGQPLSARGRRPHRRLRRGCRRRLHLPQNQFRARARGGHPGGPGDAGGRHLPGVSGDNRSRPRGVSLRGGESAARGHRGTRSPPGPLPALPARPVRHPTPDGMGCPSSATGPPGPPVLQPHRGEQRRDPLQRAPFLARGSDWFRTMGTSQSPGTMVCTVVGDVTSPGWRNSSWGRRCAR
jgi:hypothetical protein